MNRCMRLFWSLCTLWWFFYHLDWNRGHCGSVHTSYSLFLAFRSSEPMKQRAAAPRESFVCSRRSRDRYNNIKAYSITSVFISPFLLFFFSQYTNFSSSAKCRNISRNIFSYPQFKKKKSSSSLLLLWKRESSENGVTSTLMQHS